MIRWGQPPADSFERDTPHPHIRCHAPRKRASSTPRLLGSSRAVSEYWIARSSRAITAVGGAGRALNFPLLSMTILLCMGLFSLFLIRATGTELRKIVPDSAGFP